MNNEDGKPVTARVAGNVRELRKARGLDLADLSERMGALGRPVSLSGLSKVERGQRGVDVDDLVALAVALDVSPSRLLLTGTATDDLLPLSPIGGPSEQEAWRWACGEAPLHLDPARDSDDRGHFNAKRHSAFTVQNRPHDAPDATTAGELFDRMEAGDLDGLSDGYQAALAAGVTRQAVRGYLDLSDSLGGTARGARGDRG